MNFTDEHIISAHDLVKTYSGQPVVRKVNFSVNRGECLGLLGPNGAGKTTIINMLLGLATISSGSLEAMGIQVAGNEKQVKARLGVAPQEDTLDPDLTVEENLLIYGSYYGLPAWKSLNKSRELLQFFALENRRHEVIQHLSGGQRRRLLLARALIHEPELLILDEPTVGLDPQARYLIWQRLQFLKDQGVTMLLTSHYMDEVSRLSDRVVILNHGEIVVEGEPQQLITDMVGIDVFEIHDRPEELERMEAIAHECQASTERVTDGLFIYTGRQCTELEDRVRKTDYWLRRPANLEDLFIQLTGRTLQES
ncbi:MAG: ABC transporter ATP-binding protein [Desulfurivibrionaceae bacterium]